MSYARRVRAAWTPSFAVTLLASWAVALVAELVLIWNDASFLAHVPFGEGAWSVPALGFVLELAYPKAALAPPACVVRSVWLFARARGAAARGERERVVTYGFTGLFLRLEKLEGSGVTST